MGISRGSGGRQAVVEMAGGQVLLTVEQELVMGNNGSVTEKEDVT